jgi:hypothetical protein
MKCLFLIIFVLTGTKVFCQHIVVLDSTTQKPIPFATIILKNAGKAISGFYTGEDGRATISQSGFEVAEFSCLGYETQTLSKGAINGIIDLKPKPIELDELTISSIRLKDTLLGEYDEKRSNRIAIGSQNHMAIFFDNISGTDVYIKQVWLKLAKIKYNTAMRIHVYKRRDYIQKYYLPGNSDGQSYSYDSYIPDGDIYDQNIIVYLKPDEKEAKLNLFDYKITLPNGGAFIGLEIIGYFNDKGEIVKTVSSKDATWIETHRALNDVYCQKLGVINGFWVNVNKQYRTDITYVGKSLPDPKIFQTPSVGLLVGN